MNGATRFPGRTTRLLVLSALLLARVSVAQEPASQQSFEGTLIVVWGDPRPGDSVAGEIRYALALPNGHVIDLQINDQQNAALLHFGEHVRVSGHFVPNPPNTPAGAAGRIGVETITGTRTTAATQSVLGTKKVIYLLVKFSDDAAVPHPPAFYTNLNNPDTPPAGEVFPTTVNAFFKKTSWNQFSWIGDVGGVGGVGAPGGWLTLPHPKSYYAPCGFSASCAASMLDDLGDDATSLGRAQGINFANYDNINFVLSNDLDCCAWGGNYYSAFDNKRYGATWEPPWGQETGTYAHEMGHSLGLPHSGWVYSAYDSPWDMMSTRYSAQVVQCGSYLSKNDNKTDPFYCSEPGDGYIAAHKEYLGWIPAANVALSDTSSSTTVTLEGGALPLGAAAKILKICVTGLPCSGSGARYFTAEARVKALGATSQYDNAIPGEGVIIHDVQIGRPLIGGSCFFNNQSGWAVPIDATPGDYDSAACNYGGRIYPNYALYNAQWNPGQTYTNGFTISVVSRSGSTFVVSTTGTPPPTVTGIAPAGGSLAGGTNVTITGTNFTAGSVVSFGGSAATNVVVVNANTITATSPAHDAGAVDVVVTNPLGQRPTLTNGFLFTNAPIITTQPVSQSVAYQGSAPLTVAASGPPAITYQWYAGIASDTSSPIGGATSANYNTPELTSKKRYWARATNASGFADSSTATIAVLFTDNTLTAAAVLKAAHVNELRTRIDALRLKYGGLGAYAYATDPTITPGVTALKAQHIVELRAALAPAYFNATGTTATYPTDPALAATAVVKAAHISELRALVLAIE
ncbi:MAG TPA: IPT/TIG domain-containing protein [Thermoanaerobaculia bacterium]|nr:IPT/TIG domain-containing protein [Thermoanaerobaculia bacterium]